MNRLSLFCLAIIILAFILPGIAQCDSELSPSQNKRIAFKFRENRCEGFYENNVSLKNKMGLVNFTVRELNYKEGTDDTVALSLYSDNPNVRVRGVGIPLYLHYRMDLKPDLPFPFLWPLDDIIYRQKDTKHAKNVGVFGFKEISKGKIYYPVIVGDKLSEGENATFILKFVCTAPLNRVEWKMDQGEFQFYDKGRKVGAGAPIILKLPLSTTSGEHLIEIRGKTSTNGKNKALIQRFSIEI